MGSSQSNGNVLGRVWTFAQCEYDEIRRKLWVRGKQTSVQDKPLDVLVRLLEADGDPVTKEDLLDTVWDSVDTNEESLTTAIRTLRRAFGDSEREAIIRTLHRVGYQIIVPIECRVTQESVRPEFRLAAGEFVPGKSDWRLIRPLDRFEPHWIWLAEQPATRRSRVFKFAEDGVRYGALQRELTAARWLEGRAQDPASFVKVDDWRLTSKPYYLAAEYGGANLVEWVEAQRQSSGFSRALCLQLMADLCDAVEQAHNLGLVHNDLKPSNILVSPAPEMDLHWRVKVVDFGVATMANPARLAELDITNYGFAEGTTAPPGGSALYRAPEVGSGGVATQRADIYALGVILFQLLCGDFTQIPTPGWQDKIDDPLLREDIEQAVSLDPNLRLQSSAEFARRLRTLEVRRSDEAARKQKQQEAKAALEKSKLYRARQPYLWCAVLALLAGLCISLWSYHNALREKQIATKINDFLTDGLLRQSNPNVGRGVDETLRQAIEDVTPEIDERFPGQPEVAASVHHTIAQALDNATDFDLAGHQYDAAAADWIKADGPLSQDALFAQLQHVFLDARSQRPGSLDRAKALFAEQKKLIDRLRQPQPRVSFAMLDAEGVIALASGDLKDAEPKFKSAVELSDKSLAISREIRLSAKQRLCAIQLRAGEAADAEHCFRSLRAEIVSSNGPDDGNLLLFDFGIAQALLFQNKFDEAIHQVDEIYPKFVKHLGAENTKVLELLGVRAQAEGELEKWDDAIRDDLSIVSVASRTEPGGFMAVGALSDAALSECRAGKYQAGEKDAREALRIVSAPGQTAGLKGVVEDDLANCILLPQQSGSVSPARLTEVQHLIDNIDIPLAAVVTANPGWGANIDLDRAELAFARKQYDLASNYLQKAKPSFDSPGADPYLRQAVTRMEEELKRVPEPK